MSTDVNCIILRTFVTEDASRRVELQRRCLALCPDISLLPEGFYVAPDFAGGRNMLCAINVSGAHTVHAVVFPNGIHRRLENVTALSLHNDMGYHRLRTEISLGLRLQQGGAV